MSLTFLFLICHTNDTLSYEMKDVIVLVTISIDLIPPKPNQDRRKNIHIKDEKSYNLALCWRCVHWLKWQPRRCYFVWKTCRKLLCHFPPWKFPLKAYSSTLSKRHSSNTPSCKPSDAHSKVIKTNYVRQKFFFFLQICTPEVQQHGRGVRRAYTS
jgi:hypothetical protein